MFRLVKFIQRLWRCRHVKAPLHERIKGVWFSTKRHPNFIWRMDLEHYASGGRLPTFPELSVDDFFEIE